MENDRVHFDSTLANRDERVESSDSGRQLLTETARTGSTTAGNNATRDYRDAGADATPSKSSPDAAGAFTRPRKGRR
jgi:hypothetical protein